MGASESKAPPASPQVERHDWTNDELRRIHDLPLPDLIFYAQKVHRRHHDPRRVQKCTLLSIKTGGCPEDCAYCPQSAHYDAGVDRADLLDLDEVKAAATSAREQGSTRFCMGAAWREVQDGKEFDSVLEMVRHVHDLGLEVCCTLGMLDAGQARRLRDAGLTAYNHNIDTSPEHYAEIITTRSFEDRLETIRNVQDAGIQVCCGGIVGMGESVADRVSMIGTLARLTPHPESVPINALVAVAGTPLAHQKPADPIELVRVIATSRIVLPRSRVRLSAGRLEMTDEAQALCFLAGANSIFAGDRLLTTPNPEEDQDLALFEKLGLSPATSP